MSIDPVAIATFAAAVAGIVASGIALIPNLGVLHRLERVVNILEKVDDPKSRAPLIIIRDRLIDRLRDPEPRPAMLPSQKPSARRHVPMPNFFVLAILSFTSAAACIGIGVAQRTIWAGTGPAPFSGPLVLTGIVLMLLGLVFFVVALLRARYGYSPRRSYLPPIPRRPAARRP